MMKIGYVCTNYNNTAFTRKAVGSLLSACDELPYVVAVDNCSNASSIEELKALTQAYPNIHLIFSEENVGYFRGLNLGIRYLRRHHPDIEWMIVGNNDLEFPSGLFTTLSENAPNWRAYPVVSPDIITVDGVHQNPHVLTKVSRSRQLAYRLYFSNYYLGLALYKFARTFRGLASRADVDSWQTPRSVSQGHGSCYLLGPRFFELFDELWAPTFLMSEEFFLGKQLRDVGCSVYYDPALQIVHHSHAALQTLPSRRRWDIARDAHRVYRRYEKGVE